MKRRGEANRLLRSALKRSVERGASEGMAVRAIGDLSRYVDSVIAGGGRPTLCVAMIVAVVRAGEISGWPSEQLSGLLVDMQRQLERGASLEALAAMIERIRPGACVDGVLRAPRP